MRYTGVLALTIALVSTACTETPDDNVDDTLPPDTTAMTGTDTVGTDGAASPAAENAAPGDGDTSSSGDTSTPVDADDSTPAEDPADDTGDIVAAIPSRFHGEWNADLEACGTGSSVTRLRISADRLRFYESVGSVSEVDVVSDRVITVTAAFQGEGDTWQDERRLSLSADGNSLTVSNGSELVRHRCP